MLRAHNKDTFKFRITYPIPRGDVFLKARQIKAEVGAVCEALKPKENESGELRITADGISVSSLDAPKESRWYEVKIQMVPEAKFITVIAKCLGNGKFLIAYPFHEGVKDVSAEHVGKEVSQPQERNPDNAPEKKEEYRLKLEGLTKEDLYQQCKDKIWADAYAANNPHSCYHWQCEFTYKECSRRGAVDIYARAHKSVSQNA